MSHFPPIHLLAKSMQYINPFQLLNIQTERLSDIDSSIIRRAKNKLLSNIELSDNNTIEYNGIELTKSDCLRAINDLDNEDQKEFHFFIFKNPDLNSFLTNGDLVFFKTYKVESIYKLDEFLDFISPYFTLQYDKKLSLNYKQQNIENVKLLLSIKPITNDAHKELCFKGTYSVIKEIENEIIAINKDITNKKSLYIENNFIGLATLINKKVNVELLNTLPSYFQSLRNSLALTIRNLARDINNDPFSNYKPAYEIIEIANDVSTDGLNKQTILEGYYTIKKNYESGLLKFMQLGAQPATTISKTEVEEIDEDKIHNNETVNKSNITYKIFIILFCGVIAWGLFNKTIQTVILSISLLFLIIRIYYIYKDPEYIKKNTANDILLFIIYLSVCLLSFFYIPVAIFYVSYILIWSAHGLYCDVILNRPNKTDGIFGYLIGALVLTLCILPSYKSYNNYIHNTPTNKEESITTNTVTSNNSSEPPLNYNQAEDTLQQPPSKLVYNFPYITSGNFTGCSNIKTKYNKKLDNKLMISCGSNADVAVKMIDYATGKSIRYVYINKNSTYTIRNIPEGKYYLKIAYGGDWGVKEGESNCEGRFTTNALYKKGDEVLDYNLIKSGDGYQIPSFTLKLDVVLTEDKMDKFNTNYINENEFYNE